MSNIDQYIKIHLYFRRSFLTSFFMGFYTTKTMYYDFCGKKDLNRLFIYLTCRKFELVFLLCTEGECRVGTGRANSSATGT